MHRLALPGGGGWVPQVQHRPQSHQKHTYEDALAAVEGKGDGER